MEQVKLFIVSRKWDAKENQDEGAEKVLENKFNTWRKEHAAVHITSRLFSATEATYALAVFFEEKLPSQGEEFTR